MTMRQLEPYQWLGPLPDSFAKHLETVHRRLHGRRRRAEIVLYAATVAIALGTACAPVLVVARVAVAAILAVSFGLLHRFAIPRWVPGDEGLRAVDVLARAVSLYGANNVPAWLAENPDFRAAGVDSWLHGRLDELEVEVFLAIAPTSDMTAGRLAAACRLTSYARGSADRNR